MLDCDPPIDRVDAAAFAGRSLAGTLHQTLMAAGVGCTRLAIHAVTANDEELERVWRCAEPLTEDATADRVRWQLDGWLSNRTRDPRPTAAVTLLRLQAVEVVSAEALQLPLWGGLGEEDRLRARRALVRVQGLLGPEAVQVPVLSGGRGPAERITLTPLGDEPEPRAEPDRPWPGQLPEPSPAVLLDDPVELLDAQGNPIRVTGRGLFSADPARLTVRGPGGPAALVGRTVAGRRAVVGSGGQGADRPRSSTAGGRARAAAVLPPTAVVSGREIRVSTKCDTCLASRQYRIMLVHNGKLSSQRVRPYVKCTLRHELQCPKRTFAAVKRRPYSFLSGSLVLMHSFPW